MSIPRSLKTDWLESKKSLVTVLGLTPSDPITMSIMFRDWLPREIHNFKLNNLVMANSHRDMLMSLHHCIDPDGM